MSTSISPGHAKKILSAQDSRLLYSGFGSATRQRELIYLSSQEVILLLV